MDIDYRAILDRLVSVLFPPRCLQCQEVVCYHEVFCEKCGAEYTGNRISAASCLRKMRDVRVSGAIAGTVFVGSMKKAVYFIKDKQDVRTRDFFVDKMYDVIKENWIGITFDYITAVPLSPEKLKTRGFNQAGALAKALAKLLKVPYIDGVLAKNNSAQVQHSLNAYQRKQNANKAFHLASPELVADKTILLVDDVLTTGATIRKCASLLLDNGAKAVFVAAASSTPDDKVQAESYSRTHKGVAVEEQDTSLVVGFTGHRQYKLGIPQEEDSPGIIALKNEMSRQLDRLIKENGVSRVIVGLAMGTDIWMAEIVVEKMRKYPKLILECAVPFENQTELWSKRTNEQFLDRYNRIINHENVILDGFTPAPKYIEGCYQERNLYIVNECDVLLAVFHGGPSGTGSTVKAARKLDKNCIIIDPKKVVGLVDK